MVEIEHRLLEPRAHTTDHVRLWNLGTHLFVTHSSKIADCVHFSMISTLKNASHSFCIRFSSLLIVFLILQFVFVFINMISNILIIT